MNIGPGQKSEELADESLIGKSHMMRLVPCGSSKKRGRLRIDVDDDLLIQAKDKVATRKFKLQDVRRDPEALTFGVYGSAIAVATAFGLAIGYLLGRRDDR